MEKEPLLFPSAFRLTNKENFFSISTQNEIIINQSLGTKEMPTKTFTLLPHHPILPILLLTY